jgi:cyclophilin family peptidyl-prolyl cis-trans isomerase
VSGTYEVKIALASDPSKLATAHITVIPPVAISILGGGHAPMMIPRSKFNFDAVVANATNTDVSWTVLGGSVPIEQNGRFTAPDQIGTFTISARSVEDPSKSDSITVQVVADVDVVMNIEGQGPILVDLRPDQAPNTCANFVTLVNSGFYDGTKFHRYENTTLHIVQGGDPLSKTLPINSSSLGTGGPGYTIPFEANPLLHEQYALAMARRTDPDTAGSQFYFCQLAQPSLDGNYVVFGKAISGTNVVDALRKGDVITSATTQLP